MEAGLFIQPPTVFEGLCGIKNASLIKLIIRFKYNKSLEAIDTIKEKHNFWCLKKNDDVLSKSDIDYTSCITNTNMIYKFVKYWGPEKRHWVDRRAMLFPNSHNYFVTLDYVASFLVCSNEYKEKFPINRGNIPIVISHRSINLNRKLLLVLVTTD